ncbi:MAG: BlaI/MecI/CopY family transcriptional regulator [Clostridiales bacterium]|nr:BlaI/MecI/CopY family transcriptional regulator [Clostridiales bacterium]
MNHIAAKITDSELAVMQMLWEAGTPVTVTQVKRTLLKTSKWNGDTIKTLLRRLCDKGAVLQEKRAVYYYSPLVSTEAYEKYSTQRLIDKLYSGSARDMIAALVKNDQLDAADIDELRAMFKVGGADD